ncbi:MAG: beta-mannosidase [Lachnospiraceae bacterium]|nr:beta-mannosidase [Lachnospiraceae bacterium]
MKRMLIFGIAGVLATLMLSVPVLAAGTENPETENVESDFSSESDADVKSESVDMDADWAAAAAQIYEAEDAALSGNPYVEDSDSVGDGSEHSGSCVTGFSEEGDSCTFTVTIEEDGFYDLNFVSASMGGYKENYVIVDGETLGTVTIEEESFSDSILQRAYLTAGTHEITYSEYWGWVYLDRLEVSASAALDTSIYDVSATLVNENATDNAKRLMSYLADNYGSSILSGQYSEDGQYGKEFTVVYRETGKYPAILGLDFIEYPPSRAENGSTSNATDYAIQFWENGGIVTFCWHWNAPSKYLTGEWYNGFYVEGTNIDLAAIMNGEDEEGYQLLLEDIAAIAEQLQILQDAGVPVLWRPLHEASGGWFWWGASGAEAYKQLYILLYDQLTNVYGLNNLIWLWNGQDADWYPGDEYVDIIGEDIYPGEHVYTSQVDTYLQAVNYTSPAKIVVLSENGCVFDPDLAVRDGAMWGFWCTWGGEFVAKSMAIYAYNDTYTESEMLVKAYESDVVITLDELPDLTSYPIREE